VETQPATPLSAADKAAMVAARPTYFGPTRELFGFYHAPLAASRAGAIVLCMPHGWEFEGTYRAYGRLAERLAMAGFPVLRFDYHGTGNSSGADWDPDRVAAWIASVKYAVEEVRARSGVDHVSLYGVRLGALIAGLAAAQLGGISSIVMWAPCVTGKSYVREQKIKRSLNPDESILTGAKLADGGDEAGGYMLSASTIEALNAASLMKTPPGAPKYLVLGRDDLPGGEAAFTRSLIDAGVDAQYLQPPGYQAMMVDPLYCVIPEGVYDTVIEFLSSVHGPSAGGSAKVAYLDSAALPSSQVRADASSELVREEAVRFGGDPALFGIVTEPPRARELPAGRRFGVIFLNTGANPHMGPHRLFVPLARQLGSHGFVSLRFDLEGLADSPARDGFPPTISYPQHALDNVRASIDYLRTQRGCDRIALCGLCSGAYHAYHMQLADPRVTLSIPIRPQSFSWEPEEAPDLTRRRNYAEWQYYASRALDKNAWNKLLRGAVDVGRIVDIIAKRAKNVARDRLDAIQLRVRGKQPIETQLVQRLKKIFARGEMLLIYGQLDAGIDYLNLHAGTHLKEFQDADKLHLKILEGRDFVFAAVESQDRLTAEIVHFMVGRYA
jgi:alpha-beta hydrolase superfamily lysophospholipase